MLRIKLFMTRAAVCAVLVLLSAVAAQAQFRAGLQGTVTDATGAVVSGATVTLTNPETNRTQQVTTSEEGFYRFSQLAPGDYNITVEQAGFSKSVLDNITVSAEAIQGIDVQLTTGAISDTVTVTDTAGGLETENGSISRALSTTEIRQLPQVGRDPYELLRLTPGVFGDGARGGGGQAVNLPNTTGPGGSSNSIFQTENQVQISANGQRLSSNNFQIDGVSVNSFNHGGAALITPNQESVKEIRVLSASYSAEDGRNSGAQIRVVSQNGTNDFHGSAFFKYNSPKLNAFNKYNGPNAPPVRVNDYVRSFGGSLGGPLYLPRFGEGGPATIGGKDKLFFFVSYEGLRNNSTGTGQAYVETAQYRQLVQTLRPGSVTAQILSAQGIEPRIINVLAQNCRAYNNDLNRCRVVNGGLDIGSITGARGQYLTFEQQGTGGSFDGIPDVQEIQFALPNQNRGNQYNGRIDYTLNQNNSFTFSTFITPQDNFGSDGGAQGRPIADLPRKPLNTSGTILYNLVISPTTLNELRFNATRYAEDQQQSSAEAGVNFGIPRVRVEGLPFNQIIFGAPRDENTPGIFAQNIFEFSNTLSKVFGNHAMKFGFVYRNEQDNSDSSGGSRPEYAFSGLFQLANDTPVFERVNLDPVTGLPADAQRYFRTNYYAGFVQDDWKTRPNLTLNLGLRYEYYSPLSETQGRLSNLFFGSQGLVNSQVRPVDQLYEPDRNNFAPRVGFAYSPKFSALGFGNENGESTVIRGGFGVAYNRIPVAPLANVRGNPPFFARYDPCCGTAERTGFSSPFRDGQILYAVGSSNSVNSFPRNPALGLGINPATGAPNPSPTGINAAVEIYGAPQNLPNPYVYTYSLEVQQELPAKLTATLGYQGSAGRKLIRLVNQNFLFRRNPSFSAVFFPTPDVNSNYNALNANISRRFSDNFQVAANYRFSKSIDQLSFEGPGFVTNQTFPQDNSTERGPSDFDVKHFANVSGLYELPFFNRRSDFLGKALGGFSLSSIVTYRTGFPFTPVVDSVTSTPGGSNLSPVRPQGYIGTGNIDTSEEAFINGTSIPGGGSSFVVFRQADGTVAPPGIGRNSFRGPSYFNVDMSFFKQTGLPAFFGEGANFEVKVNVFNIFNLRNLSSFAFGSNATTIGRFDPNANPDPVTMVPRGQFFRNADFGRATGGFAGRVVELQGRFRF
ncbi:MAG: TonB-dependent receptor [Pyrinomonadaceae bacterium MAG19_C2-C3]|nr:TonB-dependent receptor [Pyrinomonadaceae bacterium MAG19_C2-C3]